MTDIVPVPFQGGEVLAANMDGKPLAILRPITDALGVDYASQLRKLKAKSWASIVKLTTQVPGAAQTREVVAIDMRTLTMWLATINENAVAETARPRLIAYQAEIAEAIEAYWTKGGAINPRATEDQLAAIISRAEGQMRVLALCAGLVDPKWLEAKTRHVAARALGEEPELNPADRPLTVGEYLSDRGVGADGQRTVASSFGKKLKAAFRRERGREPGTSDRFIDGALRPVAVYTEADRPLFDEVWATIRAQLGMSA